MSESSETSTDFALDAGQKPQPRARKPKSARPPESPHFDRWWSEYPRKDARVDALKAWHKNDCDGLVDTIVAGTIRLQKSRAWKDGFIPLGATFLNGARWEDQGGAPPKQQMVNAYSKGTSLGEPASNPGIRDSTMAGLNLLLLNVLMEPSNMGNVHPDCMDQLILKRNAMREWIGDRIFNIDESRKVAARAKARWREIIREFNANVGGGSPRSDARREVVGARALAAQGADFVGDGF